MRPKRSPNTHTHTHMVTSDGEDSVQFWASWMKFLRITDVNNFFNILLWECGHGWITFARAAFHMMINHIVTMKSKMRLQKVARGTLFCRMGWSNKSVMNSKNMAKVIQQISVNKVGPPPTMVGGGGGPLASPLEIIKKSQTNYGIYPPSHRGRVSNFIYWPAVILIVKLGFFTERAFLNIAI